MLVSLALASSIPVLGLESVCPRKGCPWPWPRIFFVSLALASSLVSSTPPLNDLHNSLESKPRLFADNTCLLVQGSNSEQVEISLNAELHHHHYFVVQCE